MKDTAILTLGDFKRIKQNSNLFCEEDTLNKTRIEQNQKEAKMAKARALKEKLIQIDKQRLNKYEMSETDRERIKLNNDLLAQAQRILDNNEDCVKDMNHIVLYAKIAQIRDRQLEEHKAMEQMYKAKERKLDTMMELERLKEMKYQEEREVSRKKQQREGSLIIIDQIKEREIERLRAKEAVQKEGEKMIKQIKELEEQDKRMIQQKKINDERMAKEVEEANKLAALMRDKKKYEERELDLKILKYNLEKERKEEEELAEKKRIRDEKERETQRLREKQERVQDKQAELDALRAQRAFEEHERQRRLKEKNEIIQRQKMIADLIESNEKQKADKAQRMVEMVKQDQEEYEAIIKRQIADIENERRTEEERRKMRYEHNKELMKQIQIRAENSKLQKREILEEGRSIKQKLDAYKIRMEKIKQEKIEELKKLKVQPKYISDLEKYKIK